MPIIDPSLYVYRLPTYDYNNGVYDVYLGDKNASFHDPSQITLTLGDQIVKPISQASESGLLLFKGVRLDNKKDIEERLSWYETEVEKALGFYKDSSNYHFLQIDGGQSIEKIHKDIVSRL